MNPHPGIHGVGVRGEIIVCKRFPVRRMRRVSDRNQTLQAVLVISSNGYVAVKTDSGGSSQCRLRVLTRALGVPCNTPYGVVGAPWYYHRLRAKLVIFIRLSPFLVYEMVYDLGLMGAYFASVAVPLRMRDQHGDV